MVLRILMVLMLTGCSVFMEPLPESVYNWYHTGEKPVPMEIIKVSQADVQALCCNSGGFVMACAYRIPEQNYCKVFTALDLPQQTIDHEKKHCDGWNHQVLNPIKEPKRCIVPADIGY